MLAYILAVAIGFSSFALYMAAFFFPEVHRKSDFVWSGVGLFYALILWVCAGRITGAVLLGQMAGVALVGWFGWQTLTLRRQLTPLAQQTPLPTPKAVVEKPAPVKPTPEKPAPAKLTTGKPAPVKPTPEKPAPKGLTSFPGRGLWGKKKDQAPKQPAPLAQPANPPAPPAPSLPALETTPVVSETPSLGVSEAELPVPTVTETPAPAVETPAPTVAQAPAIPVEPPSIEPVPSVEKVAESAPAIPPEVPEIKEDITVTLPPATPEIEDGWPEEDEVPLAAKTPAIKPASLPSVPLKEPKPATTGGLFAGLRNLFGFGKGSASKGKSAATTSPPDAALKAELAIAQEVVVEDALVPEEKKPEGSEDGTQETASEKTPTPENASEPANPETVEVLEVEEVVVTIKTVERPAPTPDLPDTDLTAVADALEAKTPPVEMTPELIVEEIQTDAAKPEIEILVEIIDPAPVLPEVTTAETSLDGEAKLIRPNPPAPELVQAAKGELPKRPNAPESNPGEPSSENLTGEEKPETP